ncbi:MAG: hypothetical protein Q9181_001171 [Wetmoreana brouardii]
MPGTPYSIRFYQPGIPISPGASVTTCIGFSRNQIITHIRDHGDGPLPSSQVGYPSIQYWAGGLVFYVTLTPNLHLQHVTWNDSIAILEAFALKMRLQGHRDRGGEIIVTRTGQFAGTVYLGEDDVDKMANKTLQLDPIPNPYPLPNSDLSLDFEEPISSVSAIDTRDCISYAREQILHLIQQHGDGQVPINFRYVWRTVGFMVFREVTQRGFTYNDTLDVLGAYAIKLGREGYRSRWAIVLTGGGQIIATALITRVVNDGISDHQPETASEKPKRALQLDPIPNP